ncbi:hypothetical protein AB0L25_38940 [Spirillospora sp. NPDC052242]
MVVETLTRQPGNAIEVVLTRQSAWHLFGVDLGSFQDDEVPGLTLIEDVSKAQRYLRSPAVRRRLLINCGEAFDPHALPDELAIVNLSPDAESPVTISADGASSAAAADSSAHQRVPLLTRPDAFVELAAMPTVSKSYTFTPPDLRPPGVHDPRDPDTEADDDLL